MPRSIAVVTVLAALCASPAAAQRPSYDRHFLDSTEYFVAAESLSSALTYVTVARMLAAPSAQTRGEGQFLIVAAGANFQIGQRVWTRYFWRTRAAAATEATIGMPVFCLNSSEQDVYRAPRSREDALSEGWFATTITDVSDLYRQEARAGTYRLSLACLRVDATAVAPVLQAGTQSAPAFDTHFLDTAEYFIAPAQIDFSSNYVAVGRMLMAPTETSRGEAQFLVLGSGTNWPVGQRVWTSYYVRTRPATTQEATVGRQVFCLNESESDVYRAPRDRSEALNSGWWAGTITDVADAYKQQVQAGDRKLGLNCLRLVR